MTVIQPGTVVGGDFRVFSHLASGAMGAVYIVDQLSTGKKRAMKLMSHELVMNDRARERFVLEARVGASIESDHVVEVVTAGVDSATGMPFLVMELLKGEELADRVLRDGAMPLAQVAEILKQAGHALEKAHAKGIVHRDLKPENLYIADSRREGVPFTIKILDFGIAKLVAERTSEGTQPIGTPLFMAPEQTDKRGVISPASDVWPLGLIAFYLLTGQHYWLGVSQNITMLLREVVLDPIVSASERARNLGVAHLLPHGFDGWFARCVTRDLSVRFPEAGSAVRAFREQVLGHAAAAKAIGEATTLPAPSTHGRTRPADAALWPTVGASTGLAAIATARPHDGGGKTGLMVGAFAALIAIGTIAYFISRSSAVESEPPVTASAAPPASSSATVALASACPDGMILIQGGNMFMGSIDDDLEADVRPPHKVTVSSFCIDRLEVTVRAYDACATNGNCLRAPAQAKFAGVSATDLVKYSELCNTGKADKAEHPINCVDWQMASTFCGAEGGRLTKGGARLATEAEWEFAARGSRQKSYPWGDDAPGPKLLNACGTECTAWLEKMGLASYGSMYDGDDGHPATAPAGTFSAGASSAGVLDLAGNVWEWTADWYGPYGDSAQNDPQGPGAGTERVVRGGGFNGMKPAWAKPAYRWKTAPDARSHGIGFRCAADAKQ